MSGKWTPGPWVHAYYKAEYGPLVLGPNKETICECHYPESGSETGERNYDQANANARLISASPQLFDALKDLVEETADMLTWGCEPDVIRNARAALAKVKGEGA